MKIKFWGTRGSLPAPLKADAIAEKIIQAIRGLPDSTNTKDPQVVKAYVNSLSPLLCGTAGGNTPCVELSGDDDIFIIDAGSGLRELGVELMKGPCGEGKCTIHLFLSHCHWDHIQGFPQFRPALTEGNRIFIYSIHDAREALERQQDPLTWPISLSFMAAEKHFVPLEVGKPFSVGNFRINTILNDHPGDAYSFRFEDQHSVMVYASDVEYKRLNEASMQPHIEFFKNAEVLIFDAQFVLKQVWGSRMHWGHSSSLIGVDLARKAGVKKLILCHYDPGATDTELEEVLSTTYAYQEQDPTLPTCEIMLSYEGLELDLTPSDAIDVRFEDQTSILTPRRISSEQSISQLEQELAYFAQHKTPTSSIIDLSHIETLNIADIQALLRLHQKRDRDTLVLVTPSSNVTQVVKLSGYADYFAIYNSVETALSAAQIREALNLPGHIIKERYQIEHTVGKGPLGTVLMALDLQTNHPVALKILSPTFSPETTDHFMLRAAQIVALDHPNIVKVLTWDTSTDYTFSAEELVRAPTLQDFIDKEGAGTTISQNLDTILDIIQALDYAHRQGVIHGDLKPTNIYLTSEGAKVSGFGLGRLEESHNLLKAPYLFLSSSYLAPEQILGQPLDTRTDLYALGIILYQLFTGQLPFTGSDDRILQAHLRQAPRSPRELNPDISLSEEHLILKLLAKNPNERYASAQQVLNIARSFRTYSEDTRHRRALPLIGRTQQWGVLRDCWEKALAGQGQLAFVIGEPGIGKTSLIQQVATQSQPPVLLMGQCQEQQEGPAYQLFIDILHTYFATVPPEFFDEDNWHLLSSITRLAPQIRKMLPDLAEPPALEPEQEQLRLMANLTEFIKRASQKRAWLLVLDNLQWADRSSLELLRYLGHHLPTMPLFIIGAYREEEITRGHPLLDTLHHLNSYPGYTEIVLERLRQTDVEQVLSLIWHRPVPEALAQRIYEHTEGNPRYVEEVAQSLIDDGLLTPAGLTSPEEMAQNLPTLDQIQLPQSVREAVKQRIKRLSPDAQALLHQAAILGQRFSFEHLQEMSGLSKWETLEHLDMAMERQLIQEIPGETALRFRHNEIQHVLYTDLGLLRRRMLHRQAGEALEHTTQPTPETLAETLAYHFIQAEVFEKALYYSLQAGHQAQIAYANEAAVSWYKRSLDIIKQLPSPLPPHLQYSQVMAHQALGEIFTLMGRHNEALDYCTSAWTLLESRLPRPPVNKDRGAEDIPAFASPPQIARLCRQIAIILEKRSEYKLANTWVENGLTYLDNDPPTLEGVNLYNLSGWINIRRGNYHIARTQLQQALGLAQSAHLRQAEANSLDHLGVALSHLGKNVLAQTDYELALQLYREIGDRQGESAVLNHVGTLLQNHGNYTEARKSYEQALHIYREIGDRQGEGNLLNNLSIVSRSENDYAQALALCEQALSIYHRSNDKLGENRVLVNIGIAFRDLGEYDRATYFFKQALQISREIRDRKGQGNALHNLGIAADFTGDYTQAGVYYQQALKLRLDIADRAGESETLAYLGLLAHHTGDQDTAQRYTQQAQESAKTLNDRSKQARALTFLGHALANAELASQATAAYQQAYDLHNTLNQPNLAVEALAGLAHIALAQGDLPRAHALKEQLTRQLRSPEGLNGIDSLLWIYDVCYRIAQTSVDGQSLRPDDAVEARQILDEAYVLLQIYAERIKDTARRRSFLENVSVHQAITAEWEKLTKPTRT